MKRRILALLIGAFLVQVAAGATNDYVFIRMHSVSSPWWLTVRPNGSDLLGYGSSGTDSGNFTNNTFDVQSLVSELRTGSTTNQPTGEAFNVRVSRANGDTIASFWTTNTSLVATLLFRAYDGLADSHMNAGVKGMWAKAKPSQKDDLPNHTADSIRQPADGSPKPSR